MENTQSVLNLIYYNVSSTGENNATHADCFFLRLHPDSLLKLQATLFIKQAIVITVYLMICLCCVCPPPGVGSCPPGLVSKCQIELSSHSAISIDKKGLSIATIYHIYIPIYKIRIRYLYQTFLSTKSVKENAIKTLHFI